MSCCLSHNGMFVEQIGWDNPTSPWLATKRICTIVLNPGFDPALGPIMTISSNVGVVIPSELTIAQLTDYSNPPQIEVDIDTTQLILTDKDDCTIIFSTEDEWNFQPKPEPPVRACFTISINTPLALGLISDSFVTSTLVDYEGDYDTKKYWRIVVSDSFNNTWTSYVFWNSSLSRWEHRSGLGSGDLYCVLETSSNPDIPVGSSLDWEEAVSSLDAMIINTTSDECLPVPCTNFIEILIDRFFDNTVSPTPAAFKTFLDNGLNIYNCDICPPDPTICDAYLKYAEAVGLTTSVP